jgi:hypothetical protein
LSIACQEIFTSQPRLPINIRVNSFGFLVASLSYDLKTHARPAFAPVLEKSNDPVAPTRRVFADGGNWASKKSQIVTEQPRRLRHVYFAPKSAAKDLGESSAPVANFVRPRQSSVLPGSKTRFFMNSPTLGSFT